MKKPIKSTHPLPKTGDPGAFATKRKFDIHTGIDLYCKEGDPVYAIEEGIVVAVEDFTGDISDSPWWNNTWAVLVEGKSGVIVYGEINTECYVGDTIKEGDLVGLVIPVLKENKGKTPTSMLHLELHKIGTTVTSWWKHDEEMPDSLLDPTTLLAELYKTAPVDFLSRFLVKLPDGKWSV